MHISIFVRVILLLHIVLLLDGCQRKQGVHTVGIVVGSKTFGAFDEAFKEYMHILGYVEHEDVEYEIYVGDLDKKTVEEIAEEFLHKRVDLIVTVPTGVTSVVQSIARRGSIPVIFGIANLEGTGIVNSLQRPGRNSTGVRFPAEELAIKRLDYLLELVPDARTILIPHRAGHPGITDYLNQLEKRASAKEVKLVPLALSSTRDFETFVEQYYFDDKGPFDAILQLPDPVGGSIDYFERYGRFAMNKDIVVGGDYLETDEMKSTFGIQVDVNSVAREVAFLTVQVLQGANAGTLSVLSPDPELTVNLKELKRLGIQTPYEVLYEADYVLR